jgi:hypothetical protein
MTEECLQLARASAEAAEAPTGEPLQGWHRVGLSIEHLLLHDPVALLLGVQLRRIGRQPLLAIVRRVGPQESLDQLGMMSRQMVPHHDQPAPDAATEIPQGDEDLLARNAPGEVAGIEPRRATLRRDQGHDAGDLPALTDPAPQGRLPPRRPGRADAGPKRVTGLVHEGNRTPCAASPLFTRGQSCFSQASTTASSRSLARSLGCWGLQPLARNAGPREPKW